MRGRCPYQHYVLIFDNMLALNHVRYFQIIKLYFRILMVSRLEEHLNMINLFQLANLVETCAQKYHFITPGTFAGILPHIWKNNQGM